MQIANNDLAFDMFLDVLQITIKSNSQHCDEDDYSYSHQPHANLDG